MSIKPQKVALTILAILLATAAYYIAQLFYAISVNDRSARIYEQSLIAAINQYEYLPALLAQDLTLREVLTIAQTNHIKASKRLAFIAERSGADAAYIMDINGEVRATSNYNSKNQGFLYRNYGFRPYFQRALSEQQRQFYYAKGATTGIPGFFISSPVMDQDKVIGVTVVKLDLRHWEQKWQDSGEHITVADNNGIIILSSEDKWRYRAIDKLDANTIEQMEKQQQFSGSEHSPLYSKAVNINLPNSTNKAFWVIDHKLYLINRFTIPENGWQLYYLVKHDGILTSSLIFFGILSLLTVMLYFLLRSRRKIIESAKKHQLLEIKRREELYFVMDNIHIGVTLFSEKGVLLSTNAYARKLLFGQENIEDNKPIYLDELIQVDTKDIGSLVLEDGNAPAYHESVTAKKTNASIPVMFAISQVNALDRDVYLMTIVNIQRRKDAEEELIKINHNLESIVEDRTNALENAQKQLIQKNKAAALGNMAATIVHELSQPLTAMNTSIATIEARIQNDDWQGVAASANRLGPLSTKMQEVIKLLRFFSYRDDSSHKVIDLHTIVNQTVDGLTDLLKEKGIHWHISPDPDPLLIDVNPLKIDLVISNILRNAIDALEKTERPIISIHYEREQDSACLVIEDNAGGVDPKIMAQMFNPYFTTKEVGKGLGLGLAITYEIIQEYNGTITVANTTLADQSQGARFAITLPYADSYALASGN